MNPRDGDTHYHMILKKNRAVWKAVFSTLTLSLRWQEAWKILLRGGR